MLSGALLSLYSTGLWLILQSWQTFKLWVRPLGRSFADKAGGKGDLSDNLNAATPSCWQSDQEALTISFMSEMYPTAAICLFWERDSFCIARRFWLPCYISKKSWTLALLCNFLSSASFFSSESFPVLSVSLLLARANCLTMTISQRLSRMVFDCL